MNIVQRTRTASLARSTQLCAFHTSCPWTNSHRPHASVAVGRLLRQRPTAAAAGAELNCQGTVPIPDCKISSPYAACEATRELSQLSPRDSSGKTAKPGIAGALLRLWHALQRSTAAALRLLGLAAVFCLASLLPRPSPSFAAATAGAPSGALAATCSAEQANLSTSSADASPYSGLRTSADSGRGGPAAAADAAATACSPQTGTGTAAPAAASLPSAAPGAASPAPPHGHTSRLRGLRGAAAVQPLADVAASAAFASGPPGTSPSSSSTGLRTRATPAASSYPERHPASPSASSASLAAPASASPALDLMSPNATTTTHPSASIGNGGGGVGSSSSQSAAAVASTAASAAAAADPEAAALVSQLGLGWEEAGVVRLFEGHRASVVNISGMRAMQTFTTLDLGKMPYGQGSGFLWGEKGHVVTCYHLVKGSAEVKVTLYDNTSYTAKVLGYDAAKNVAVLKLSVPKSKLRELQPVTLGSAAGLRVGQTVYGIGNPWGLGHTLSQGLVCGLGSELSAGLFPIKGVILTDSAPDPGSSGGVLLDSKGSLVGMVLTPPASSGGGGGGGGRSFAVPIDAIRGLIAQILAYGRTVRPALGITMAPAQVLERVGLEGVLVLEVPPGSPSHAAGLRPTHRDIFGDLVLGDVIVGLDSKAVRSSSDVYDILDEHRVGDRVKVDVVRDGKQTGLSVTLGERLLGAVEE